MGLSLDEYHKTNKIFIPEPVDERLTNAEDYEELSQAQTNNRNRPAKKAASPIDILTGGIVHNKRGGPFAIYNITATVDWWRASHSLLRDDSLARDSLIHLWGPPLEIL